MKTYPFTHGSCPNKLCGQTISVKDVQICAHKTGDPRIIRLLQPLRCITCGDEKQEMSFMRKCTAKCVHDALSCRLCVASHIKYHVYVKKVLDIPCLFSHCPHLLSSADVAAHTDTRTAIAFQKLGTEQHEKYTACSNIHCSQIQRVMNTAQVMRCAVCHHFTCTTCQRAWTPDKHECAGVPKRTSTQSGSTEVSDSPSEMGVPNVERGPAHKPQSLLLCHEGSSIESSQSSE